MKRAHAWLLAATVIAGCAQPHELADAGVDASAPDVIDAAHMDASDAGLCSDGKKDGAETDVDCGGPACAPCADGLVCIAPHDCKSGACSAGTCGTRAWSAESYGNNVTIAGTQQWVDLASSNLQVNPNFYAAATAYMRWTGTLRFAGGGNGDCHVGQRFVVDDVPTGDPTWGNSIMVENGSTRWHEMFTTEMAMPLAQGLHTIRVQMTNASGWGTCYLDGDGGAAYEHSHLLVSAHDPTTAWYAESTGDTGALGASSAFVAIPGVSVTMNLPASRHVQISLTGTQLAQGTSAVGYCAYRLVIDGMPQGDATWGQAIVLGDAASGWWAPVSLKYGQDLAAGMHTISAQITNGPGASGTCDAGQGNNPYARFRMFVSSTPMGGSNVSVESTGAAQILASGSAWTPVDGLTASFTVSAPTPVQLEMAGIEETTSGTSGQCAWQFVVDGAPLGDPNYGQAINVGSTATTWWTAMSLLFGASFDAGNHTVSVNVRNSSNTGDCGTNGNALPYGRARLLIRTP